MDELEIAARKLCEIRGRNPDTLRSDFTIRLDGKAKRCNWEFFMNEIKEEKKRHEVREALGYEKTN